MEFTQGGKVACHAAEELLLLATAVIWRTAGDEHAGECLRAMIDKMEMEVAK
jgi:hypothetical protein